MSKVSYFLLKLSLFIAARPAAPNYFIGIRLHGIQKEVDELNERLVSVQSELKHYLTSTKRLHFTSFVLSFTDNADVTRALEVFSGCQNKIQDLFRGGPRAVSFHSLSEFPGKVLYLEPEKDDTMLKLHQLTDVLKNAFGDANLLDVSAVNSVWSPHVTIAKKSKNMKRRLEDKNTFKVTTYGSVTPGVLSSELTVVELLSMQGNSSVESDALNMEGYYRSLGSISLFPNASSTDEGL